MAAETQLANWQNAVDNRFDFEKSAYQEMVPELANANAAAEATSNGLNQVASTQGELAGGLADRVGKFAGMQDQYADTAFGYNSADRQGMVVDKAKADASSQYANLAGQAAREMSRRNVNPASGRMAAMSGQLGINQAALSAGLGNKALSDLESVANERQKTAIGFGANLPGQSSAAAQVAASVGSQSTAAATAPLSNKLAFTGGISNLYANDASGNADLWRAQNLTAAQAATLSASQQASEDANNAALLGVAGKVLTTDAGQKAVSSGWDWLTNKANSIFNPDSPISI